MNYPGLIGFTNRKRLVFCLLFSAFIYFPTTGQNIVEGYWGVKGGLNLHKISKIEFDNSMKPGFHLGIFANFQLSDQFSIQHEVLYSLRGVSLNVPVVGKYVQSFSFLDLPWMLNYHVSPNFFVSAGVQPSLYTYFKSPKADTIVYNKDNVNTVDFGYLLGASFISQNNFGFGVRFNGSIVPAFDLESNGKNYVLQVFVSYSVNKRKSGGKARRARKR